MTTAAWLLATLVAAGPSDTEGVLAALEQAGRRLKTMHAGFQQTRVVTLLDEEEVSQGEVKLQVPGRFRWDYHTPQPSVLVVKDGRFGRYFPKSKQVFRGKAEGEADLLVGFGPGASKLDKKYAIVWVGEERVAGRMTHVLDLTPRQGQEGLFATIRLWIDQERAIPLQTRLTEPTGDHTTVLFTNVRINDRLGAKAFDLQLPKDVVEAR